MRGRCVPVQRIGARLAAGRRQCVGLAGAFESIIDVGGLPHSGAFLVHLGGDSTGAPKTNRTSDLPLRRGLLYPLSYRGVHRRAVPTWRFYRDRGTRSRHARLAAAAGKARVSPP